MSWWEIQKYFNRNWLNANEYCSSQKLSWFTIKYDGIKQHRLHRKHNIFISIIWNSTVNHFNPSCCYPELQAFIQIKRVKSVKWFAVWTNNSKNCDFFLFQFLYWFILTITFEHRANELCMQNIFDLGFFDSNFIQFMLTVSTAKIMSVALS